MELRNKMKTYRSMRRPATAQVPSGEFAPMWGSQASRSDACRERANRKREWSSRQAACGCIWFQSTHSQALIAFKNGEYWSRSYIDWKAATLAFDWASISSKDFIHTFILQWTRKSFISDQTMISSTSKNRPNDIKGTIIMTVGPGILGEKYFPFQNVLKLSLQTLSHFSWNILQETITDSPLH